MVSRLGSHGGVGVNEGVEHGGIMTSRRKSPQGESERGVFGWIGRHLPNGNKRFRENSGLRQRDSRHRLRKGKFSARSGDRWNGAIDLR